MNTKENKPPKSFRLNDKCFWPTRGVVGYLIDTITTDKYLGVVNGECFVGIGNSTCITDRWQCSDRYVFSPFDGEIIITEIVRREKKIASVPNNKNIKYNY